MKKLTFLSSIIMLALSQTAYANTTTDIAAKQAQLHDNYQLQQVVVLSRHNIRAPLSGKDSKLGKVTSHQWIDWSANPSELTSRGGILETAMGQYFRKWLESEGVFTEGKCPTVDEINVYANSMQRTIATAEYFAAAFSPTCAVEVNHRFAPSKMDPIFFPRLTKTSPEFEAQAMKEINQLDNQNSLKALTETLKPSFQIIENVLDMKDSPACKNENICQLDDFDTKMIFKQNQEPNLSGSLKLATSIADALVLQYFEANDEQAAFGKKLSSADWEAISKVKDVYGDILFTAPSVAANVAHPLITYMKDELNAKDRKFTYLVGHDSNIGSVTKALGVEDYSLPNTIEKKTPIGSKLVFEKWVNKQTQQAYVAINLVYQTTNQLRHIQPLDLKNKPMIYTLKLEGLTPNDMGLYDFNDVNARFQQAISQYEQIK
ncbi:glucose-1-phosphatase [Pasteurella langaaensis DSM 22999]|uniref:Glucose-1-phosphatase n=1 Tax=Alitibacter langaaensis DSM 22999 TaxID=1122935 RepID=A0A2U0SNY9_9PAST|nr:histidine-type phosphatase [Pasteurella langaaensis]PVX33051.1 glucose-1-phosphatase [Pasteurella langaaensis DSM 22999]